MANTYLRIGVVERRGRHRLEWRLGSVRLLLLHGMHGCWGERRWLTQCWPWLAVPVRMLRRILRRPVRGCLAGHSVRMSLLQLLLLPEARVLNLGLG